MERLTRHLFSRGNLSFKTATVLSNISSLPPRRFKATEATQEKLSDQPISYTKSKAFTFKASQNFRVKEDELTYASYTSFVVKASVFIFLIYFGILRESNDIDEMLDRDLFEIMPELEIPMLENEVKRLESHGINTDELRIKIQELKKLANLSSEKKS